MRDARKIITNLSLALTLAAACAAPASAQSVDERVISARAGGVNFVSGEVKFRRAGGEAWRQLATTDELGAGDAVRTGADGRAEILLNPGSYLRLGETSEFELTDPSLDSLRLRLSEGSALVEAAGYGDADVAIALDTPRAPVTLVRSGVYRVGVAAGATEVFVRKGRALVGVGRTLLKEGMSARVGAAGVAEVAKFDQKGKDALDVWGKSRAQELARAQRKLQARQVNAAFTRTRWWDSWSTSNGLFGVWYWSAGGGGCYTFLPFYFYMSPYGYSYDMELPAFAYLCGGCNRHMVRPRYPGITNPTPAANVVTTTQIVKPAKSLDFTPDFGAKTSPAKGGVHIPPAGDGGSPVVHGGAPTKGAPPPR
jgi:hypothetical protein